MRLATNVAGILGLLALAAACRVAPPPAAGEAEAITDAAFLEAPAWDDGRAEVAFYEVRRTRNQYGRPEDQRFLAGTYVVKHDFDPAAQTKAEGEAGVPAFKYALFYEIESGSYVYKRNWVVNSARAGLAPLKDSFSSFDWCANQYRELAFLPDGTVEHLYRSDDYGNDAGRFAMRGGAFTPAQLPMLVRALDFSEEESRAFAVVLADGRYVPARARLAGADTVGVAGEAVAAERIEVRYDEAVPSMVGEESDTLEVYWRGTDPMRLLLRLESGDGRYRMDLVEHLRSAYWEEDFWPRLRRVEARP